MTTAAFRTLQISDPWIRLLLWSLGGVLLSVAGMEIVGDDLILEIAALASFLLANLVAFVKAPGLFILYFVILFNAVGQIGANIVLGQSFHVSESGFTTYDIGAMPLLVTLSTLFFATYFAVGCWLDRPVRPRNLASRYESDGVVIFASLPILVALVSLLVYGSPWLSGETRNVFLNLDPRPQFWFTFGLNRLDLPMLFAGMLFAASPYPKVRRSAIVLWLIALATVILTVGGRGGSVVSGMTVFFLPFLVRLKRIESRLLVWCLVIGGIGVAIMLGVTLVSYLLESSGLIGLAERLVLQGHVWWDIYYVTTIQHVRETGTTFWHECCTTFFDWVPPRDNRGSDVVLRLVAPPSLLYMFERFNARFAAGWPAMGLYYFGSFGVVAVQIAAAALYAALCVMLKREVLRANYLAMLVLYYFRSQVALEVLAIGELYKLINIRTVLFVLAYLAIKSGHHMILRIVTERQDRSKADGGVPLPGNGLRRPLAP